MGIRNCNNFFLCSSSCMSEWFIFKFKFSWWFKLSKFICCGWFYDSMFFSYSRSFKFQWFIFSKFICCGRFNNSMFFSYSWCLEFEGFIFSKFIWCCSWFYKCVFLSYSRSLKFYWFVNKWFMFNFSYLVMVVLCHYCGISNDVFMRCFEAKIIRLIFKSRGGLNWNFLARFNNSCCYSMFSCSCFSTPFSTSFNSFSFKLIWTTAYSGIKVSLYGFIIKIWSLSCVFNITCPFHNFNLKSRLFRHLICTSVVIVSTANISTSIRNSSMFYFNMTCIFKMMIKFIKFIFYGGFFLDTLLYFFLLYTLLLELFLMVISLKYYFLILSSRVESVRDLNSVVW